MICILPLPRFWFFFLNNLLTFSLVTTILSASIVWYCVRGRMRRTESAFKLNSRHTFKMQLFHKINRSVNILTSNFPTEIDTCILNRTKKIVYSPNHITVFVWPSSIFLLFSLFWRTSAHIRGYYSSVLIFNLKFEIA